MLAVAGAVFMAVAEEACARPAEAAPTGGRIHRLLLVPERHGPIVRLLCARRVDSQHGPATTVLDPAVISRAGISEWEIPCPRRLASPMADGIPLAARRGAVDLR